MPILNNLPEEFCLPKQLNLSSYALCLFILVTTFTIFIIVTFTTIVIIRLFDCVKNAYHSKLKENLLCSLLVVLNLQTFAVSLDVILRIIPFLMSVKSNVKANLNYVLNQTYMMTTISQTFYLLIATQLSYFVTCSTSKPYQNANSFTKSVYKFNLCALGLIVLINSPRVVEFSQTSCGDSVAITISRNYETTWSNINWFILYAILNIPSIALLFLLIIVLIISIYKVFVSSTTSQFTILLSLLITIFHSPSIISRCYLIEYIQGEGYDVNFLIIIFHYLILISSLATCLYCICRMGIRLFTMKSKIPICIAYFLLALDDNDVMLDLSKSAKMSETNDKIYDLTPVFRKDIVIKTNAPKYSEGNSSEITPINEDVYKKEKLPEYKLKSGNKLKVDIVYKNSESSSSSNETAVKQEPNLSECKLENSLTQSKNKELLLKYNKIPNEQKRIDYRKSERELCESLNAIASKRMDSMMKAKLNYPYLRSNSSLKFNVIKKDSNSVSLNQLDCTVLNENPKLRQSNPDLSKTANKPKCHCSIPSPTVKRIYEKYFKVAVPKTENVRQAGSYILRNQYDISHGYRSSSIMDSRDSFLKRFRSQSAGAEVDVDDQQDSFVIKDEN